MSEGGSSTRLASMSDVAAHAGVSRMTVSNVINRPQAVSEETLRKVRSSMRSLNYRNNLVARSLRLAEPRQLGYLVTERDPNAYLYLDEFMHQLAFACQRRERNLTIVAETDRDEDMDACENLYYGQSVAGIVLSNVTANDQRPRELTRRGVPVVAYGQTRDGAVVPWSWVKTDGARGIGMAVAHVASIGHRELAFIGYSADQPSAIERRRGYDTECERLGLVSSVSSERVITTAGGVAEGGSAAQALLDLPNPPTALICVNDSVALGAISALRDRGLVPGADVAITGFDNNPMASLGAIGITSIRHPADLIAQRLVDLLVDRPVTPQHLLLEPTLIVRGTTVPSS